jgi:phosphopantetheine--protein transferase-like protein
MLIGLGQDLQHTGELSRARSLTEPEVFFTAGESAHVAASADPTATATGIFCAKEALFKALSGQHIQFWTDIEVVHAPAPAFQFHGTLGTLFATRRWQAWLSISHSGEYAAAVVAIEGQEPLAASSSRESRS